jgi:hypothetical protein
VLDVQSSNFHVMIASHALFSFGRGKIQDSLFKHYDYNHI